MDQNQHEVNATNVVSLVEKRKEMRRKQRSDGAVAEGRIVANWINGDGTSITRIRLSGNGAQLFRMLMADKQGVHGVNVPLGAIWQVERAGVKLRLIGGPFGFLALRYPAERYVLEEGTLAA